MALVKVILRNISTLNWSKHVTGRKEETLTNCCACYVTTVWCVYHCKVGAGLWWWCKQWAQQRGYHHTRGAAVLQCCRRPVWGRRQAGGWAAAKNDETKTDVRWRHPHSAAAVAGRSGARQCSLELELNLEMGHTPAPALRQHRLDTGHGCWGHLHTADERTQVRNISVGAHYVSWCSYWRIEVCPGNGYIRSHLNILQVLFGYIVYGCYHVSAFSSYFLRLSGLEPMSVSVEIKIKVKF